MIDLIISKIPAKDLISGKSKYIKNGNIKFDAMQIELDFLGRTCIKFYLQEVLLASTTIEGQINSFSTLLFKLERGSMQMIVEDKPDLGSRERIKAAITEIREALNEEEEI